MRTREWWWRTVALATVIVIGGCAAPGGRAGTIDGNSVQANVEATAAVAKVGDVAAIDADEILTLIETLDATLAKIGDIALQIGGEGDTVTAWIYACIAGAALFYPTIWRPIRKSLEKRGNAAEGGSTGTGG